jgi:hypothetical protein
VINLAKTWEKLMLAARIIVAIENPADGMCRVQQWPHARHAQRRARAGGGWAAGSTESRQ